MDRNGPDPRIRWRREQPFAAEEITRGLVAPALPFPLRTELLEISRRTVSCGGAEPILPPALEKEFNDRHERRLGGPPITSGQLQSETDLDAKRAPVPPRSLALRPHVGPTHKRSLERWALIAAIALLSAAHLAISVGTHPLHVIHVLFRGLYLLPIIAGAFWFGLRGGVIASLMVSAAYLGHILLSWRGQPMENVNQFAMIGVYLFVGVVSGMLVRQKERQRSRHLEAERRAQRRAIVEGIASLASALGHRDRYTREHSERVSRLAVEIGKRRGLSGERLERLRLASVMHDVGKIGVRDDILLKPKELTPEERSRIERHPMLAANILRPIQGIQEIAEIVVSHHECPDGSGYPRGLKGEEIPLEARILRVADVFSALTDARVYKPAMDPNQAIEWMRAMSGTKLDAGSVQALRTLVEEPCPDASLLPTRQG